MEHQRADRYGYISRYSLSELGPSDERRGDTNTSTILTYISLMLLLSVVAYACLYYRIGQSARLKSFGSDDEAITTVYSWRPS